jgi:multidrug efflux pump
VRERMAELQRYFPKGMKWTIPYDSSRFVKISITQVVRRWSRPWRWCSW